MHRILVGHLEEVPKLTQESHSERNLQITFQRTGQKLQHPPTKLDKF